jgi:hypothetical protein
MLTYDTTAVSIPEWLLCRERIRLFWQQPWDPGSEGFMLPGSTFPRSMRYAATLADLLTDFHLQEETSPIFSG